jgi:hypothetical protein
MAFAASNSSAEPRSFAYGNRKIQIMTYSAASGDTSGTITADSLAYIDAVFCDGKLLHTAAPTYSGNVATLAFANPAATVYGTILVIGH